MTTRDPWLGHRDLCPLQWGEPCDCPNGAEYLAEQDARYRRADGYTDAQAREYCICDTNPSTTDGPDEDCPLHGRNPTIRPDDDPAPIPASADELQTKLLLAYAQGRWSDDTASLLVAAVAAAATLGADPIAKARALDLLRRAHEAVRPK
jgi:hypothetical protein